MNRIRSVLHKGKQIIYFDYREITDEAVFIATLRQAAEYLMNQNRKTLHLVNLNDVYITPGLVKPIIAEVERFKPYVLKEAILGITGAKRILFQTYLTFFSGNIKSFSDEDAALEWLVSDDNPQG